MSQNQATLGLTRRAETDRSGWGMLPGLIGLPDRTAELSGFIYNPVQA